MDGQASRQIGVSLSAAINRRASLARLSLACALGGFTGVNALAEASVIGIGMSLPLTGPRATIGLDLQRGVEAAVRQANAEGGIQGRRVVLKSLDDGGVPARTADNTRGLIGDPTVAALVAYASAEAVAAAIPLTEAARLAIVGVASGADSLRSDNARSVFHVRAGHGEEAAAIVTQLDLMGIQSIGVLYQNDALGRDGLEGAKAELSRLAIRPAAVSQVDADGGNADRAAQEMASGAAAAILVIAGERAAAAFLRAHAALNRRAQIITVSDVDSEALTKALGPLARGVGMSQVVPLPTSTVRLVVRSYQAAMKAEGQTSFSHRSLEGYICARIAMEAIRRSGRDASRERILQALETLDMDLGGYRVRFTPRDRRGSRFTEMTIIGADGALAR